MRIGARRGIAGLGGVALVALAAVTVASATIPDGNGVIRGSYTPGGHLAGSSTRSLP